MKDNDQFLENGRKAAFTLSNIFEQILWKSRLMVLLAVVASLAASLLLFVIGTYDIFSVIITILKKIISGSHTYDIHAESISAIIGAIDIFLIAVVLLIFSLGLYELFVSRIDPARDSSASNILDIKSLDSLKDKIAKVILMALIVKYFQMVLHLATNYSTPLDMIYLAVSILALSGGLFLIHVSNAKPH